MECTLRVPIGLFLFFGKSLKSHISCGFVFRDCTFVSYTVHTIHW